MAIPQKLASTVSVSITDGQMLSWSKLRVILRQGDSFYYEATPVATSNTVCAFEIPASASANINPRRAIEWQFIATDADGVAVYTIADVVSADKILKEGVY